MSEHWASLEKWQLMYKFWIWDPFPHKTAMLYGVSWYDVSFIHIDDQNWGLWHNLCIFLLVHERRANEDSGSFSNMRLSELSDNFFISKLFILKPASSSSSVEVIS